MATPAHSLTTKEKVKLLLGITVSTDDALIDMMIGWVTDFIENYCGGRRFKETTYTNEEYDQPEGDKVFLRNWPVSSLTSVQYRTGTIASPTFISFDANDYILYGNEGFIKFFARFHGILGVAKALRFSFVAGYKIDFANELSATHTLPFDLTAVATQLVANIFNTKDSGGLKSESTEGQSVTYADMSADNLSDAQKQILSKYTIPRITT